MLKSDLAIHQDAAEALTRAGLGTYIITVDEEQRVPITRRPLSEDSPYVVVRYTRVGDTFRLWRVIERARATKLEAEYEGKPQEEIDQAVQGAIRTGVHAELSQEAYRQPWQNPSPRMSGK